MCNKPRVRLLQVHCRGGSVESFTVQREAACGCKVERYITSEAWKTPNYSGIGDALCFLYELWDETVIYIMVLLLYPKGL